jgi:folate-binding protein YgfZ
MTAVAHDQIDALRTGAAFCSPDQRFLVRVTGTDVMAWLERLLSMSVAELTAGHLVRAVLMDGKGKMRMDLRVIAPGDPSDGLLLDLPLAGKDRTLRLLDMYVIKEDVAFTDLSTELRSASLIGPKAADVLRAAGIEPPEAGCVALLRDDVYVVPTMLAAPVGYDLFFDGTVGRDLVGDLLAAGAVRTETSALTVVRVAAGVPWFANDLASDVIPLEANLDAHVSIHKGCYPGQEVVARILNLGQVARRLVRLDAAGEHGVAAGAELFADDGKSVGILTSTAFDPTTDTTCALGFVKRKAWDAGTVVTIDDVAFTVRGPADGHAPSADA